MNLLLKLRTNFKRWDEAFLEWHGIPSTRVPSHARLPALDTKNAKATEFYSVTFCKCANDAEEEAIDYRLRLELCKPSLTGDLIDDISFRDVQPDLFEQDTIVLLCLRDFDGISHRRSADGKHTKAPYSAQP